VSAYVTHGVLSGKAVERVEASVMNELVVMDSIASTDVTNACKKIRYLSTAPLLAEAIKRISEETSVSSLFD
jgi:ribose-phosphate pyrophosphokinase